MAPGVFGLLMAAIMFLLVQITYNFIALPIISRSVKLPAAVVLIAVLAALAYGSPLLAFLVPPLLSTLRLVGAYVLDKVRQLEPMPEAAMPEPAAPGFFSQLFFPVK
jgi:predicted PurR-regulated permease PerM